MTKDVIEVRTAAGSRPTRRRGPLTWALVGLLGFLGIGAVGGGTAMVAAPGGELIGMDPEWLASVPLIDDWLVPGLWLTGLGMAAAATAWVVARGTRPAWAHRLEGATGQTAGWVLTQVIGLALVLFIAYESTVVTAPEGRWMQVLMGAVGLALLLLPWTGPVRRDLRNR